MKIDMYTLLGMVKDGKAPKRIKFDNTCWDRINGEKNVYYINDNGTDLFIYFFRKNLTFTLNDEVEILDYEEKEKKIPKKLEEIGIQYNLGYIDYKNIETLKECLNKDFQTIYDTIDLIIKNQNKLIDYLKSKGE